MAFKRSAVRSRLSPPKQTTKPWLCGLYFIKEKREIGYLQRGRECIATGVHSRPFFVLFGSLIMLGLCAIVCKRQI